MKHLWGALLVLALSAFMPSHLSAQGVSTQTGRARGAGLELGQNYPNPFNPETRIPFTIGDGAGYSASYQVAYSAAYGIALINGVREGKAEGTIAGQGAGVYVLR